MHPVNTRGKSDGSRTSPGAPNSRSAGVNESGSLGNPGRRTPIPWQELVDPLCGVIMQPGEHIGEPSLRIDVIELGALD